MIKLLEQAYRKLKSHLYTDKTLLNEKIELARFESSLSKNLETLAGAIEENDISKWTKTISYTLVPKKLEIDELDDNFFSNQTKYDQYKIESYNIFISASIEIHLISTLWTMLIGEKLDGNLIDNIKGNRLHRDKNGYFKDDSYKLFKPYYEGYQNFRDEAIGMATYLHQKKLDVTVLNLDIQEFYYNIDFDFSSLENIQDKYALNTFMQQIHDAFHGKVKKLKPREDNGIYDFKKFLPIGLVSSSVIANYVLTEFDNDIVRNLKPEYYSRYVDDMLFVFSNADISMESRTIVTDLLAHKLKNTELLSENDIISISTNHKTFKLQNKKVRLFQFYKDDSISLLEKFKEKIDENSSFFNFMPDDEKLFKTLESSSYNIFYDNSENKLSSLVGTSKDSLKISRNLTGVLSTISSADFDKTHLYAYSKQIQNVFTGASIFELRSHWEKLFTYLYLSQSDELFVQLFKSFYETISKIQNPQQSKLIKDTKFYLFYSVFFAVAASPRHFTDVFVQKIRESGIPLDQLVNTDDIRLIRKANMFSQYLMTYPLLNYTQIRDKNKFVDIDMLIPFNYLSRTIALNGLQMRIDDNKIDLTPRFIHYHEIILFEHYLFINDLLKDGKDHFKLDTDSIYKKYLLFNQFKNLNNDCFPAIHQEKNLYVIDRCTEDEKDKLKIGIVSIKTLLKDIEAAYVDTPNLSYTRLQGIFDILNRSIDRKHKVDLLVFPEVSIPYAWVHLMARFAKKNDIGLIFGIEHIKVSNVVSNYTCVMLPFKVDDHVSLFVNFESKKHFAPDEKIDIESRGFHANENKNKIPTLYQWRGSIFSTFNCYELTNISYRSSLVGEVDFLVAIEYNKDTNHFSNIIDSLSRDIHCYVIQVNTSDYGDSRIVQPSKTVTKDLVKLKGGENIYLVVGSIDIEKLRDFQAKGHCVQKEDENFKLTPPNFNISPSRS